MFPKIGGPQNGRFVMEIPIKMDDLGVPPFSETPICKKNAMFFIVNYVSTNFLENSLCDILLVVMY